MRADARRNRRAILDAAKELVGERGADVPLDAVAARAEVGAGTLYRHFPDRQALFEGLVGALAEHVTGTCRATLDCFDEDPEGEWRAFVDALVDLGVGSLFPAMGPAIAQSPGFDRPDSPVNVARLAIGSAVSDVLDRATAHGLLREDVSSIEFVLLVSKAMRPVAIPALVEVDHSRAVAVLLAGLRPDGRPLPGVGPVPLGLPEELARLADRRFRPRS